MLKKAGGIFLLLILVFFIFMLPIRTDLLITTTDGELVKSVTVKDTDYFEVSFRHSVNKGLVIEKYHINRFRNSFYLETGWFESYGAGMLDELPENVEMTDDGKFLKLDFPKENLTNVWYSAAGFAGHKIKVGDTTLDLFEINPYKKSEIKIRQITIFKTLIN